MFTRAKLILAVALGRMLGSAPLSLHKAAMDHNRTVDVLRAAREVETPRLRRPMLRMRLFDSVRRLVPNRLINRAGMHWGPNGAQECARRMRQIAAGTLTISNGLVCPGVEYLGHGIARYAREDSTGQTFSVRA